MKPWQQIIKQNADFRHATRALLSAISTVIINNVLGQTQTSRTLEAKQRMSGQNVSCLGMSDYKF